MYINNKKVLGGQGGFAAAGAVILVALGILALIVASYYSNFFGGNRRLTASIGDFVSGSNLEETVKTIVSDLGNVQAKSKTGVDEVAWGVCFRNVSDSGAQDIYEVVSNITSTNSPCDIGSDGSIKSTIRIPSDVTISDPGQGSSRYVTFQKVTGETTSRNNLNFTFTDGEDSATITITPAGVITYSNTGSVSTESTPTNDAPADGSNVPTAPSAPRNPATATGVNKVAIAWSAPAFSGGSAIIEYRIYRSTSAFGVDMALIGSMPFPNTVFVDSNVSNNVTYFYRVDARNGIGAGPKSAQVSATPFSSQSTTTAQSSALPSAPLNVSAVAGNNQVTISWSEPNSTGSSAIIDYRLYRSTVSGGAQTLIKTTSARSVVNTDLVGGVTYFYTVDARNSAGIGPKSSQVSATPNSDSNQASGVPSAPRSLVAKSGDEEVTLTWAAPSSNASSVTGYRVYYGYDSKGAKYNTDYDGTSRKFTHTGLRNGTKYYYVVVALNDLGESARSNEASATPGGSSSGTSSGDDDDCSSLESPRNLKASASGHKVTLTWDAPEGDCDISSYTIYRLDPGSDDQRIVGYPDGDEDDFTDNVPSDGQYHYWISAYNGSDRSDLSSQAIVVAD